jgi:uncharacterized protein YecE (DUF72 family)
VFLNHYDPSMQNDLFGFQPDEAPIPRRKPAPIGRASAEVLSFAHAPALHALAQALPAHLRLGTSSWAYPGWDGLVWDGAYAPAELSKNGLGAYAAHPLLRCVGIDRSFYRPLSVYEYAAYARQVPDDFRFVVKAPSLVSDALVRQEDGRGREPNPAFLDPTLALETFVTPALQGLGHKLGALVFQLSPLPRTDLRHLPEMVERLRTMLLAQPALKPEAPDAVMAVEVRDKEWLSPTIAPLLAAVLQESGATYCLGLHAKMPPLAEQLPLLRALWPGPLVCRWNLNPVHGAYGYEEAERQYSPYKRLMDVDEPTRALLASTLLGVTGAGQNAYVTVSNEAEGCAPLTIAALAERLSQRDSGIR